MEAEDKSEKRERENSTSRVNCIKWEKLQRLNLILSAALPSIYSEQDGFISILHTENKTQSNGKIQNIIHIAFSMRFCIGC